MKNLQTINSRDGVEKRHSSYTIGGNVVFPGSSGIESACNEGNPGSIPGSGRSLGEGNGNPFQYSCLRIPWTEGPWGCKESDATEWLTRYSHGRFHSWGKTRS